MRRFASTATRRFVKQAAITTTLAAALLMPGIVAADTEVYVSIPGIVGGPAPDAMFSGQIFAHSASWSVSQETTGTVSSVGNISAQRATIAPFTIVKPVDQTSVPLAFASIKAQLFSSVVITVLENRVPLMVYRLDNVLVSSVSTDITNGQAPLESVSLAFTRVTATSPTRNPVSGMNTGSITRAWDISLNRAP